MPHLNILTVILKMKNHIFIIGDGWMLGGATYTHMHMVPYSHYNTKDKSIRVWFMHMVPTRGDLDKDEVGNRPTSHLKIRSHPKKF